MLCLSRKIGEEIVINENIRIVLLSIGRYEVRIGIEAPDDIRIDRSEIHEIRKTQKQENVKS